MLPILRFLSPLVLGVLSFAAIGPSFAQVGYVHEVSGSVTAQVGAGSAGTVSKGQSLVSDATITTGANSYAILKFEDGTVVVLKENTAFQVQNYAFQARAPENASAVFNLLRGGLRLITGLVTSRNREALRVATPLATIGIRGTEFTAELTNPLFVGVQVGVVAVTNGAGTALVSAGQFMTVATAQTLGTIIPAAQVPPGVLQMPKVPIPAATPAPTPPGGTPVGGAAITGTGAGTAALIGGAVAAGIAAGTKSETTTTHH